jgi:hypothetical protein
MVVDGRLWITINQYWLSSFFHVLCAYPWRREALLKGKAKECFDWTATWVTPEH